MGVTLRNYNRRMGPIKDSHFQEAIRSLSYTYSKYGLAGNPNVLTWLLGRKPYSFEDYIQNELETLNLQ